MGGMAVYQQELRASVSQALLCTDIRNDGDFDSCTKAGVYIVSADSGEGSGFPAGAYKWGHLLVLSHSNKYVVQLYIPDDTNEPLLYLRNKFNGGVFRQWTKITRTVM